MHAVTNSDSLSLNQMVLYRSPQEQKQKTLSHKNHVLKMHT